MRVKNKRIVVPHGMGQEVYLPIPSAPEFWDVGSREILTMVAYNNAVVVLERPNGGTTSDAGNGRSEVAVLDRAARRWRSYRVTGSRNSVKAFGSWVAGTAGRLRDAPGSAAKLRAPRPPLPSIDDIDPATIVLRSGRRESTRLSPWEVEWRLETSWNYYPGVLWLIDASAGKYLEIQTGEQDSEILLVEAPRVWFRVKNKLYGAEIRASGTGPWQELVADDALHTGHWAFHGP